MSSPEYVRVPCTECEASVRVETSLLGEWVTCPKCSGDFLAKDPNAKPASKSPKARPVARPAARDEQDEEELDDTERRQKRSRGRGRDDDRDRDRDRNEGRGRRSREEDDEDEDQHEPEPERCPKCRSYKFKKVSYTWWGGIIGPAIMSQVRCLRCGQNYNRNSGKPIGAVHIIVYSLVILVIAFGILGALAVAAGR